MEYIIKSSSYRLQKDKINELTINIDKDNITYYDLTNDSLKSILEECNYNSLFNDKKAIIVYNTNLFNTKYEYKEDLELLEKYLNNPNVNTELIFLADSINLKKKCVKIISDNNNLYELTINEKELNNLVLEYIKSLGYKIENNALNILINNQLKKYDFILNEIDKVITIKENKTITLEDINSYTTKIDKDDLFDFVDVIIKKDDKKIYKFLIEYIEEKKEPAILLSNIASQYRLIYCVKNLIKEGYREQEMAKMFNIHEYRVKLAHNNSYNYTNEELKEKLLFIGELDEKIKLGKVDKYSALKNFLISL